MNILPRILTFLSHEKSRMIHELNESLRISRKLPTLYIVPNRMIPYRNFSTARNPSTTDDLLLLQRNINKGIITRLKREKSTRSNRKKDDSKQCQGHIEDHRQSAESCEEPREWRSDGYQISAENYQRTRSDIMNNGEYYRSSEFNSPICSDKPVPYNNRQACESSKHESYESKRKIRITSKKWTCGKPATESKIYYKCKPKSCTYRPNSCEKTISVPDSRDCCKDKSKQTAFDPTSHCLESEPSKKIMSTEEEISPVERKISKKDPASDIYEYHTKPDPPPPRSQHCENPLSYCDYHLKKTTYSSPVKASPMIFIPHKGPRKSRAKDTTSSPQNIHEVTSGSPNENQCGITDAETPHLRKSITRECIPRCVIFFEDKCAASLTVPASVNRTMESKIQQFPTLTKDGRCCVEKPEKFVTPEVSDCNPNTESLKYRLNKCSRIKEMCDIKREPPVDVSVRQEQGALLSRKKMKRPESRPETARRKRKRFKSRVPGNGWTRQSYKVRLRIFQKRNSLDPCVPRITKLRQSRGEEMRSKLLKSVADESEFFSQSRSSCPHYCPSETPIAETKSYPTKMNESRVIRDQYLGKQACKKRR